MASERVIGRRFVLLAQIGKGGMGSVYRARDLITSRIVAVKLLTLDRPADLTRFGREANLLATVRDPHVVDYVAHGESDGQHFLAQEWVDGLTFAQCLQTTGVTVNEALQVGNGLASALAAIHRLGIVHRDVKPPNAILANQDPNQVKLVDFGIARMIDSPGALTRTGIVVGTPGYMSPEQARGRSLIEPVTDVWALGCVLYEALTGRLAFPGLSPTAIRAKVILDEPTPLSTLCPEAPRELAILVHAMLTKDPALRPLDGAAVLDRLREIPSFPASSAVRRRVGAAEPPTKIIGSKANQDVACFAFVGPPAEAASLEDHVDELAAIATLHNVDVHMFDDGSALLAARQPGKAGAIDATRAALDMSSGEVFDGGLAVFAKPLPDEHAFDRGAMLLDRAQMGSIFADAGDTARVVIDDIIAELIAEDVPVVMTGSGPALKAQRRPS